MSDCGLNCYINRCMGLSYKYGLPQQVIVNIDWRSHFELDPRDEEEIVRDYANALTGYMKGAASNG